jgi:hypothetical protein
MTDKELLYVKDALGHEKFLASQSCKTSGELQDAELKEYLRNLESKHQGLLNRLVTLL